MNDNISIQSIEYYKNLDKHTNCSKCNIVLTWDNYKRGRTVCKLCYNNNVLTYYKNKFCSNPAPKSDVSTQTDFSNELDSSNNIVKSKKVVKSKKQPIMNNFIKDLNPNLLCERLQEILSKPDMLESDYTMSKMILDELLRTKSIPRKQYNVICKNIGLI